MLVILKLECLRNDALQIFSVEVTYDDSGFESLRRHGLCTRGGTGQEAPTFVLVGRAPMDFLQREL